MLNKKWLLIYKRISIVCDAAPFCEVEHSTCDEAGISGCSLGHCNIGFINMDSDENSPCIDVDECAPDKNMCKVTAESGNECINTVGSFVCICKVVFFSLFACNVCAVYYIALQFLFIYVFTHIDLCRPGTMAMGKIALISTSVLILN